MKVNRLADGVFSRIVGNSREINSYDRFMNIQSELKSDKKVLTYLKQYKTLIEKNKETIQKLANLEEIIMLYRIKDNLDIQYSTQREYVYARQFCPRTDTRNQDIRICVSKTEYHDVNNLEKDKLLVEKTEDKVREQIMELLQDKESKLASKISK
jgi:hypothetical protein